MRISIIIPVYNVELYVEECLQSVANQTMTEGIECIIVDDRGQDNSAAIAKQYIDSYKGDIRFTFIQREKNGGLSAARNTGIEAATGEYVYFLDSDDYLVPSAIETLISICGQEWRGGSSPGTLYHKCRAPHGPVWQPLLPRVL